MRTTLAALFCLIVAIPALADPPEPTEVHVIAYLEAGELTAAEFRVDGIPYDECLVTEAWNSPLTIGSIGYGFAILFVEPQPGPLIHLGTLSFLAHTDVGEDRVMWVLESLDSGYLVLVDDEFETIPATGGRHTFNCSEPAYCTCSVGGFAYIGLFTDLDATTCEQELPVIPTPTEPSSWGLVKSLY